MLGLLLFDCFITVVLISEENTKDLVFFGKVLEKCPQNTEQCSEPSPWEKNPKQRPFIMAASIDSSYIGLLVLSMMAWVIL